MQLWIIKWLIIYNIVPYCFSMPTVSRKFNHFSHIFLLGPLFLFLPHHLCLLLSKRTLNVTASKSDHLDWFSGTHFLLSCPWLANLAAFFLQSDPVCRFRSSFQNGRAEVQSIRQADCTLISGGVCAEKNPASKLMAAQIKYRSYLKPDRAGLLTLDSISIFFHSFAFSLFKSFFLFFISFFFVSSLPFFLHSFLPPLYFFSVFRPIFIVVMFPTLFDSFTFFLSFFLSVHYSNSQTSYNLLRSFSDVTCDPAQHEWKIVFSVPLTICHFRTWTFINQRSKMELILHFFYAIREYTKISCMIFINTEKSIETEG